jgi:hypothetical protein
MFWSAKSMPLRMGPASGSGALLRVHRLCSRPTLLSNPCLRGHLPQSCTIILLYLPIISLYSHRFSATLWLQGSHTQKSCQTSAGGCPTRLRRCCYFQRGRSLRVHHLGDASHGNMTSRLCYSISCTATEGSCQSHANHLGCSGRAAAQLPKLSHAPAGPATWTLPLGVPSMGHPQVSGGKLKPCSRSCTASLSDT